MASSSILRTSNANGIGARPTLVDLETRATKDDHQALRLWLRLLSCNMRIENHVSGRLRRDFGTTLPRFDLMAQLERNPSGLRMSEISKRLMVSGGNVTGITDQLEREGLVVRTLDPSDRRAVTVRMTDLGLKRFRELANEHERWIIEALDGLNREEKQTLLVLLKKLKTHLTTNAALATTPRASNAPPRRK
jgi:DNA-binding MarR family transcriptional regulator